jgi:hypothetical protein
MCSNNLKLVYTKSLNDGMSIHNGKCDALSALVYMFLRETKGTVGRQEISKHTGKHSTIISYGDAQKEEHLSIMGQKGILHVHSGKNRMS